MVVLIDILLNLNIIFSTGIYRLPYGGGIAVGPVRPADRWLNDGNETSALERCIQKTPIIPDYAANTSLILGIIVIYGVVG